MPEDGTPRPVLFAQVRVSVQVGCGMHPLSFTVMIAVRVFGNARLRRAFWVAAQVAIRQPDNSFRAKNERYIARDRDNAHLKRKVLTAITAKMARTAHAVIKSGSDYRPFFEGSIPRGEPLSASAVRAHPRPCR